MSEDTSLMLRNLLARDFARDGGAGRVGDALRAAGVPEAFLVGGAVRDRALGLVKPVVDYDIALPAFTDQTAHAIAAAIGGTAFCLDEEFGAWRASAADGFTVDLFPYRGVGIEGDLAGRDFTLNAIAYDLLGGRGILDPLDGLGALAERTLYLCSREALDQDPLRVLRAYRFAAVFDFNFAPGLGKKLAASALELSQVSGERIRYELFRLFAGDHATRALRKAVTDGTWEALFPFILKWKEFDQGSYHSFDLLEHSLKTVESLDKVAASPHFDKVRTQLAAHLGEHVEADVTRLGLMRLTGFFHDIAKPMTLTVERSGRRRFIGHDLEGAKLLVRLLTKFKVGKRAAKASSRMVASHLRLFGLAHQEAATRRSRLRYLRDLEEETPEAVLLSLADELATGPRAPAEREALFTTGAELLELFFNREEVVEPLLRGRDLVEAFGLAQGPVVGMILAAVADAEATGRVNDREEALKYAGELAEKLGGAGVTGS